MANIKMKKRKVKERVTLYEELRLVELSETEVNGIWKGAQLLLFFLAFVFGAFCTFCFHMLMYMFDEKCVLYPKLLSLSGTRHSVLYDFMPNKEEEELLPVDFVSTQWGEKSTCYLPTYVPLLSGLFGLVWTTMFLMCSSGGNNLSGFKRSWRIIPSVFVFSVFMSVLCIYASSVTQWGLQEMCAKLGEITGSTTCTYTINVATLLYDRRIRGVYQAVKLTILTAWLHTCCWILAALLALLRVLLVVDFGLVRIRAELQGDIDKMLLILLKPSQSTAYIRYIWIMATYLERHEKHIKTVSPDIVVIKDISTSTPGESLNRDSMRDKDSVIMHFTNDDFDVEPLEITSNYSSLSLVPDEEHKLIKLSIIRSVPEECKFIPELVYRLIDDIVPRIYEDSESVKLDISEPFLLTRQKGKEVLNRESYEYIPSSIADENIIDETDESKKSTSGSDDDKRDIKKTILKTHSVQTEEKDKKALQLQKVLILENRNDTLVSPGNSSDETLKPSDPSKVLDQTNIFDFSKMTQNIGVQTGPSLLENEQVNQEDLNYKAVTKEDQAKTTADIDSDNEIREKNEEKAVKDKYEKESKESKTLKEKLEKFQTIEERLLDVLVNDEEVQAYRVFEPKKKNDQQTQVNEEDLKQAQDEYYKKEQEIEANKSKEKIDKETQLVAETSESETQGESLSKKDKNVQATPKEKQD